MGKYLKKSFSNWAGALVQWYWETIHVQEVMGSNPYTVYWMNMKFFHIDLLLKLYCLFEKTENKRKRGRVGPFKKSFSN